MNLTLKESYRQCVSMSRRAASNFYWSFWLLPRDKRLAMCALYAFSRHTDDLADSDQPVEKRRAAVTQWRELLAEALDGKYHETLLPALADTARRFQIPGEYLLDIVDGVTMDLQPRRYQSWEELQQYCHRVASAVGLACVHIWGFTDDAHREPALACGLAFQLTNILRDLKEDAASGRIYLPIDDLDRFHYSVEDISRGVVNDRFGDLMQFEIRRAEQLYRDALPLTEYLHRDGRRTFQLMMATYWRLLKKIRDRWRDVLSVRIRLSRAQKLKIIFSNLAGGGMPKVSNSDENGSSSLPLIGEPTRNRTNVRG